MSLYHASRNSIERYWLPISVSLAVLSTLLLPLNLLSLMRFHHDEALYATWALNIASGQDVWLTDTPIDKPPLYLYILAATMSLIGVTETATRLPSLLASALSVLLTFWLGRRLYSNGLAVLAAWLVALSPFTILFAPTTFTDPLLLVFVLAGCLAAVYGRAGWAGLIVGLAIATKQQGVFFVPLVIGFLIMKLAGEKEGQRKILAGLAWFGLGVVGSLLPAFIWDVARNQPSGFLELSVTNYGGLGLDLAGVDRRWQGFMALLFYATASPVLNTLFFIGWPVLIAFDLWQSFYDKQTLPQNKPYSAFFSDIFISLFILGFLLIHTVLSFQVWDRYLLGLIPFFALLFGRILLLPWTVLSTLNPGKASFLSATGLAVAISFLLAFTLFQPVQDAANGRYPLGSNSHALSGIEQIVAYLQGSAGANHTLYHRWLGTHWRFYLAGYPYDLQYWDSPAALVKKVQAGHLIAFPAAHSDTLARLGLHEAGFTLVEIARAYAPNGKPTIILYRVENIDN